MGNNSNIIIREAHRPDIPEIGRIMSDNYHDTYADILDRRYMASVNPEPGWMPIICLRVMSCWLRAARNKSWAS